MHYKPEHGCDSTIDPSAIYLLDSGAQYLDGTTDTTRTIHIGNPTEMEIEAYTRALKANIAMDRAIFPQGVSGFAIDCIARQHLWVSTFCAVQIKDSFNTWITECWLGFPSWYWSWSRVLP